ncbi:FAD-binding oxidoreductase [Nonomuraea sp. NN258]|uniref:NAD(P)/FAD-dependent oxidoreductase n=1 Tax=Nonomuraea antri TaxID=2730852 RepID=UPI0015685ED4|nr:FAD-dependent oxidoreductase [Nonomuraea antri]NRQ31531.1 FAD-binding oxidoreductase [Nonomuraea antri]
MTAERTGTVVIGGGVIGLSIAFHLAEAGVATVLLERDALGSGASKATADVVRAYFAGNVASSALAVRSLAAYHAFPERPGFDLPLRQVGYLVLFTEPGQVASFEADLPGQRAAGVEVELISPDEARRRNPLIGDDVPLLAAAWSPAAYVSDTAAIVKGYAEAARNAGAELRTHCPVTAVDPAAGLVHTTDGPVRAEAIVCAAGAWSGDLARSAGVRLPLTEPVVQELLTTGPLPRTPDIPVTLHAASGLLVRLRGDRLLIGMGYPDQERELWRERVATQLAAVYPGLAGAELHTAVTGVRDASPDRTAFLGRAPGAATFLYAAGFSGHGLCNAPAAGELIRDLCLGRDPELGQDLGLDLARLSATPERAGER